MTWDSDSESYYEQQIKKVDRDMLQSMIEAERKLRMRAEELMRDARAKVVKVATRLAPATVDRYQLKSPDGISKLSLDEIADFVIKEGMENLRNCKRERDRAAARADRLSDRVETLEAALTEIDPGHPALLDSQEKFFGPADGPPEPRRPARKAPPSPQQRRRQPAQRRGHGQREIQDRPQRRELPQRQDRTGKPPWRLAKARPAPAQPSVPFNLWSNWAQEWRNSSGNFDRDCDVILVAGGTGLVWRIDIAEQLAQWWDVSITSGSVRRAFGRVKDHGLIELVRPDQETAWRPGYLIGLADRGAEAYRFLRGEDPAMSQLAELMRRHKTPEHVALNLKVAEFLWRIDYTVEIFPDVVPVGEGKVYYPDLKAELTGETIYVECERAIEGKKPQVMAKKLDLCCAATDAGFYFATPTESDRERLITMLSEMEKHGAVPLHTTSIEYLEVEDYEVTGENVWIT